MYVLYLYDIYKLKDGPISWYLKIFVFICICRLTISCFYILLVDSNNVRTFGLQIFGLNHPANSNKKLMLWFLSVLIQTIWGVGFVCSGIYMVNYSLPELDILVPLGYEHVQISWNLSILCATWNILKKHDFSNLRALQRWGRKNVRDPIEDYSTLGA